MLILAIVCSLLSLLSCHAASTQCEVLAIPVCNGTQGLGDQEIPAVELRDYFQTVKDSIEELDRNYQQQSTDQTLSNINLADQLKSLNEKLNRLTEDIINLNKTFTALTEVPYEEVTTPSTFYPNPSSCAETKKDGVFTLSSGEKVYCSDGWTVFQRRDGSIPDFHLKNWKEYASGFGSLEKEFWLGLRKLHQITRQGNCRLRADLRSYDNSFAYAEYSSFAVASEDNLFRLSLSGYNGSAGDSFSNPLYPKGVINGMAFSTFDRDHDRSSTASCASFRNYGGWWHNDCSYAKPNAVYGETIDTWEAIIWYSWRGISSLQSTMLKVRCN